MKNNGLILAVAILALIGGMWLKDYLSLKNMANPSPLPNFSLADPSGQTHAISEWDNKIRVINFWATWCPPCRKEIPELIAIHKEYANQGVVVIGIAIDDLEAVNDYLNETPINYPLLMASDNGIDLSRQLGNGIEAIPFTLITDFSGQIIYRHPGRLDKTDIEAIIKPLLKQNP